MLTVEALEVLSILVDLQELDSAKEAARGLLNTAPIADLWTIARSADILDTNNRIRATAKLDQFASELTDEHRAALVRFCRDETGDRPPAPPPTPPHSRTHCPCISTPALATTRKAPSPQG